MKSKLIFLLAFVISFFAFSQTPINDAIEDAIEITTTSFTNENLRLDLADVNSESISGCDASGFSTVFYKFTAPFTGDANAVILDQDGTLTNGGLIFTIFYTAPDLNVTSVSELITNTSPCASSIEPTNTSIIEGQPYYILAARTEANMISRIEINFEEISSPDNDLLINATEISGTEFVDDNLRLDYATSSSGGQSGCDTTEEVIYYKYTATQNAFVSLSLTNNSGNDSEIDTSSFIRVFEAPSLNITSETDLVLASNQTCDSEVNVDVEVVLGQSYYFLVHRPDQFETTAFNFELVLLENNSIINATEITTSSFTESNLRLDLASESAGGQSGCSTMEKVLYYKFTADSDSKLFTKLIDDTDNPITGSGSTFVYIYEAPNLSVTSESELTLASGVNCNIQYGGHIDLINGQSYYILINRDRELAKTSFSFEIDVSQIERQALIDFYISTGGNVWWFGDNWNDDNEPVKEWEGVYVENAHVISMYLNNDNLNGEIPNSILNLQFLESANFTNNYLSGEIPDFSSLPNLEILRINSNNFSLADFETNYENNSTIDEFVFSPQRLIDDFILIEDPIIGEDYTFTMTEQEGTDITYQWVKRPTALFEPFVEEIAGANSNEYTITNFQLEDGSTYSCFVTSPLVSGLTIERNSIKIRVPVSQSERDALIALFNATDGENWSNTIGTQYLIENWNSPTHVDTWSGVETFGNKVIYLNLNFNNLNGELPDEIGDLIHLRELRVSANSDLTGPIPSSIGNLTELQWLRLQSNGHTGEIPASIGNLSNLNRLYLSFNELSGNIPSSLGNASELLQLILEHNQLDGVIPGSLGNLTNLVSIQLNNNNLSGSIPSSIGSNAESMSLDVSFNNLSGPLPEWTAFLNPEFTSIKLQNNFYSFSDLEPLVNNGVIYGSLVYSPQNTPDEEEELTSPPGVDITLDVNDTDINRNTQDPSPNNVYQWFKDGEIIDGANTNPYTIINAQPSDSGVYHCEITNPLVPDLTIVRANITVTVDDNLAVENFNTEDFKLYPNPADNWLSIKTNALIDARAQIFDINGKLLFERTLTSEITAIAVDLLPSGIYLITVTTDDKQSTKRFIKQ